MTLKTRILLAKSDIVTNVRRCLFKVLFKVLGKVVEAAKAEEKKVSMVRQNKGKILKVTFLNLPALLITKVTQDQENTPPCGPESA